MKRAELLRKLGYDTPDCKKVRVIVHTDLKNEADDHFAVMHHLMTPNFDIRGVIAGHFEGRYTFARAEEQKVSKVGKDESFYRDEGRSMELSYQELKKLLKLSRIEDVPIKKGCPRALASEEEILESEGAELIIQECMRADDRPLYIALQGCLTDVASALNKEPAIAEKMTIIWIGGNAYPEGGIEFNLMQDLCAVRKVFSSGARIWQIPADVYQEVEVSFADLAVKVRPCGAIGEYLFQQLLEVNEYLSQFPDTIRKGENWCLGDQPTVGVLLQNENRAAFHIQRAPEILNDMTYKENPEGQWIRVYDRIDARLLLDDFFAKLNLCYGK